MLTYYQILDLPEDATLAAIKAAYRVKAKLFHPDLNPDPASADRFFPTLIESQTLRVESF